MKLLLLLPVILVLLFASTSIVFAQSLGMSITATADRNSDTITVTGKTISDIADVTFRVTSPIGNNVVTTWQVSPDDNGEFMVNFIVGPTWEENGFYKIEAKQAVHQNSLYTLHVLVEVNDGLTERTFVTDYTLTSNLDSPFRDSITIQTDKSSYSKGEIIHVTGEVSQLLGGYAIFHSVIAPNGNLVSIEQLTVGADKKFSTSLAAGGALMKTQGTYTVTVQYGDNKNNVGGTTFEFGGSTAIPPSEIESNVPIMGTDKSIQFSGLESIVKNMHVDKNALSIIFSMNAKNSGSFTIDIPRSVLDATLNDRDIGFFVLVDGVDVRYVETKSSTHRKLIIPYTSGAEEIEIIGTFVVGASTLATETNSKCGPGTIFNADFNSCVLIPNEKHVDNNPINENISLQEKNTQLKIENKQLKNQITKLDLEIANLQNILHEQIKVIMDVLLELKMK